MFCEKCGSTLPDKAVFCEKCGQRVKISGDNTVRKLVKTKKKQTKPIPRMIKVLVLETIILAALLFVAFTKIKKNASPETVAKSYFTAVMAGDVKEAYDFIDVDESEFVNENYFGKLMEDIGNENVYNYKIDDMNEIETDGDDDSDIRKTVTITYRLKEDTTDYFFYVQLEKSSAKKNFIFDDWKVNIGDYIQKDVNLYVRQGSKVMIDGQELRQEYLADTEKTDVMLDQYVIPKMFYGTYKTLITHDMFTDYEMSLLVDEEKRDFYEEKNEDEESYVTVKPEILETILQQGQKDFKVLWDNAVQQKAFDSVQDIRTIEDNAEIKEEYQELAERFELEDGTGLQQMTFGEFKVAAESGSEKNSGYPYIWISFSAPFSCVNLTKDWWYGTVESHNESGDYEGTMTYTYVNGEWALSDISIADFSVADFYY